jgi:phosphoenolpyruvate---glycerone phosphotransferase subunit DhaL
MTAFGPDFIKALVAASSATIAEHADALTALDQAIGDGDHGINMKRGFEALVAEADVLSTKPVGEALKSAGMKLVMTVGGASGPLFGTFLMTLGKEVGDAPDRTGFASAFAKAVDAVAARGKSERGQKTMLDVLYPVSAAIAEGNSGAAITAVAHAAADATVPVKATRGRASFLGERSIGHMDPGARSTALLVETVATFLEETR